MDDLGSCVRACFLCTSSIPTLRRFSGSHRCFFSFSVRLGTHHYAHYLRDSRSIFSLTSFPRFFVFQCERTDETDTIYSTLEQVTTLSMVNTIGQERGREGVKGGSGFQEKGEAFIKVLNQHMRHEAVVRVMGSPTNAISYDVTKENKQSVKVHSKCYPIHSPSPTPIPIPAHLNLAFSAPQAAELFRDCR